MEVTGTPPSSEGISTAPEVALGMAGEEEEPPPRTATPFFTEYVHATPSRVTVSADVIPTAMANTKNRKNDFLMSFIIPKQKYR